VLATEQGGRAIRFVVLAAVVVAVQAEVALLIAHGSNRVGVAVLAIACAVPIVLRGPAKLGVLVFPAVYLSQRFGAGGLDFSYADVALIAGVVICLAQTPWADPIFRRLLFAFAVYMTILAVPLAVNPSRRAFLECFHRAFLVIGAVAVGSAVARAGWTRVALRLYVLASLVVSVAAVQYTLSHDRQAATPFDINKNAGGLMVVCAIVTVIVARQQMGLWRWISNVCLVVLFAGELAFQSRGSVAALAVVLLLSAVRMKKRSLPVPIAGVVALGLMARATLDDQAAKAAQRGANFEYSKFGTVNGRIATYEETLQLWRQHRLFGLGIRFWRDPVVTATYAGGEPHNLLVSALGEAGIVGAVGLVVFILLALWALRGARSPLWLCARYLVIAQVVSGLGDIYWRAGTGTIPWLVVGLAVGTAVPSVRSGVDELPPVSEMASR